MLFKRFQYYFQLISNVKKIQRIPISHNLLNKPKTEKECLREYTIAGFKTINNYKYYNLPQFYEFPLHAVVDSVDKIVLVNTLEIV